MRQKNIEIWATGEDGRRCRLNEFRGENGALQGMGAHHARYPAERERLLATAVRAAGAWRGVFPHDKIEVVS